MLIQGELNGENAVSADIYLRNLVLTRFQSQKNPPETGDRATCFEIGDAFLVDLA